MEKKYLKKVTYDIDMTKYNIFCKDELNMKDIYVTLKRIHYGFDDIQVLQFMPNCIAVSTHVYTEDDIKKMLLEHTIERHVFLIVQNVKKEM